MAFDIKKMETRTEEMLTWFAGICSSITDFNVGSKIRSKFETVAVSMEEQDMQFCIDARRAIEAGIYMAFGFGYIDATTASGSVIFACNTAPAEDIIIPSGTQVSTTPSDASSIKIYETQQDYTITAGTTTVTATVFAVNSGTGGNTGALTITQIKSPLTGVDGVSNPAAFTNGSDREKNDARRARFQTYIGALHRGTYDALVYAAKLAVNGAETVRDVYIKEPEVTPGNITCYIYNGGSGASSTLISNAQNIIDGYTDGDGNRVPGYKAAGIIVTMAAATPYIVNSSVGVYTIPGYDKTIISAEIGDAIGDYLTSLKIGESCYRNELIERIMAIDGVRNIDLYEPSADIGTSGAGQVITAGTATVTFL